MLTKIVELPSTFSTGEATIQVVATSGRNGATLREKTSLHRTTKLASESPALDLIRSIEPKPGRTAMLIIGLGDYETYGPNRRGDGFPSEPIPGRIAEGDTLKDWFHTYDNAHVFRHHINHDPAGAVGKVIKAFWNPYMRRVEVVQYIDNDRAPDVVEKLLNGTPLACSMGARVPYDVCTKCGNRAVTRAEYCLHLRDQMGEILPDGTQVAALNPRPSFFDSSLVTRPADRTGYVLKKVADATGRVYELWAPSKVSSVDLAKIASELRLKAASLRKLSDIEKTLSGTVEAASTGTHDGTLTIVSHYADHTMANCNPPKGPGFEVSFQPRIDATSGMDGASVAKEASDVPREIKVSSLGGLLRYMLKIAGVETTEPLLRSSLAHTGEVHAIFAAYPRFYADVCKIANIRDDATREYHRLEEATAPYVDITKVLGSNNVEMRPLTDKLTYTDPHGHTYETTVGLARRARNFDTVANQTRPLQIGLSAVGLGNVFGDAGHRALLHRPSKELMTNEGERIMTNTEMVRKTASAATRTPLEMVAVDFRARDGRPGALTPATRATLWSAVKSAEVIDDLSDALGPTLDLQKIAYALGRSIVESIA